MTNKTEGERLVALETKVSAMADDVKDIKVIVEEVRKVLPVFVTEDKLATTVKNIDDKIENLRKAHTLQTWLVGILGTGFGIVLGTLLQYYLTGK